MKVKTLVGIIAIVCLFATQQYLSKQTSDLQLLSLANIEALASAEGEGLRNGCVTVDTFSFGPRLNCPESGSPEYETKTTFYRCSLGNGEQCSEGSHMIKYTCQGESYDEKNITTYTCKNYF